MLLPPFLQPGDTIGIAATARKIEKAEINAALRDAQLRGFNIVFAENLFHTNHQFAGTDEERAAGINSLLKNPEVKAIWCARGGYGSVRLLDKIDWNAWRDAPKWLCGFSDVTALHLHLQQNLGIASIHSEMMLGYAKNDAEAHTTLFNVLQGRTAPYAAPHHPLNRAGKAEGELIGGNLSVLYSMLGSTTQPNTNGKILFLEDLDEYLYHIDRMLMALDRANLLAPLAGLVIGGMSDMNDNTVPFGKTAEEIIADVVAKYNYPVTFNFPAGHINTNLAFVLGATTTLVVDANPVLSQTW